jgi:predicted TPR repeat methyltransferase
MNLMEEVLGEKTLSLEEAIQFALELHKSGRLTEAEGIYRQIVAVRPHHSDACHLLGLLMFQLGRKEEAETWMRRAVASAPGHADAHNNLGNLLKTAGKLQEAEAAYRTVLSLRADSAAAHNNLGIVLKEQGRFQEAVSCFLKAVELEPEFADAHYNRGNALLGEGKVAEAIAAYEFTLSLAPTHLESLEQLALARHQAGRLPEASRASGEAEKLKRQRARELFEKAAEARKKGLSNEAVVFLREAIACHEDFTPAYNSLGFILNILGRTDDAVAVWRQWLQREPDNAIARHMIASVTGEQVPDRASDEFVKATFEGFASTFDEKLRALQYQAPGLIIQAVGRNVDAAVATREVLDAGCGTGLCGEGLRPFSRRLAGVDLSAGMLANARERSL